MSRSASHGKLYLIPSNIVDGDGEGILPESHLAIVRALKLFYVEKEKSARKFLKLVNVSTPQSELEIFSHDKHREFAEFEDFFAKIREGQNAGLISEAGAPCIADPGASLVMRAHKENIPVIPLVGPSSIFLALMASGLDGQHFTFHGYLPIPKDDRMRKLRELQQMRGSQIFIETPYRNDQLIRDIVNSCNKKTLLCIASSIGDEGEFISTRSIEEWQKSIPTIGKKPCVFILSA